jgi:hypothetical protein
MDNIRKPFSELKKVSSSASLLPDPRFTMSGHDGEGSGISANVSQTHSRDPPSHPDPMLANEGCRGNSQRRRVDVDEKEVSWRHSSLDPGTPSPSFSCEQEPDSTWTFSPQPLCLTIRLDNADTSAILSRMPQGLRPNGSVQPSATSNEKKLNWMFSAWKLRHSLV